MVTMGNCAALLMSNHVEYPLASHPSAQLPFSVVSITPAITTRISLCYRKDSELSPQAADFVKFFNSLLLHVKTASADKFTDQ